MWMLLRCFLERENSNDSLPAKYDYNCVLYTEASPLTCKAGNDISFDAFGLSDCN